MYSILFWLSLVSALAACSDGSSASPSVGADATTSTPGPRDGSVPAEVGAAYDAGRAPANDAGVEAGKPADTNAASEDAGESRGSGRESLIAHDLWKPLEPADDPFGDRPADPSCPSTSLMAELLADERVFSVETGACHYLTVTQPSRRAVAAGESLKVRLWHFALTASMPAEAHASVVVDGVTLLDERVTIPGPGGLLVKEVRVTSDIPAGAPVYFHLHNHGDNSWSLVEVSAGP